ncbi:hypothetical protein [Acinetobacter thermotolerans]|uniref:hypothetical protein n=1 Tax=Acinetobacter thermotolerans TaxID=3151487 RepID=UPI00325B55FB
MQLTEQEQEQIDSGNINPELAQKLIDMEFAGAESGDTTNVDTGNEPDVTTGEENTATDPGNAEVKTDAAPAQEQTQQQKAEPDAEPDPENTVILTKDGKHTIPYDRLVQEREQAKYWKQQALAAQQQLEQAQQTATTAQAQANAETAQAAIEASGNSEEIIKLFGDFSEEAIAKGVQALIAQQVPNQIQAAINQALAPLQQQQQLSAAEAHFAAIHEKHPDAESIAESQEFDQWLKSQPSIVQGAYQQVLEQGSAQEVIELLDLYKGQNNSSPAPQTNLDAIKEKAKQAVQNAQTQVPLSVSDFPAGSPAGVSREERLDAMDPVELLEEMQNWTEEQREAFLNRKR